MPRTECFLASDALQCTLTNMSACRLLASRTLAFLETVRSVVRVQYTLTPLCSSSLAISFTTARLYSFSSSFPSSLTAPSSLPPCPASKTITYCDFFDASSCFGSDNFGALVRVLSDSTDSFASCACTLEMESIGISFEKITQKTSSSNSTHMLCPVSILHCFISMSTSNLTLLSVCILP